MYTYRTCRDTVYVYGIICIYDFDEPDGRVDGRVGGQAGPRAVSEREFGGVEACLLFPLVVGVLVVWWRCAQTYLPRSE
jgi:hypothetical protein